MRKRLLGYGWESGRTKQVVYVGEDGHIHELWVSADGGDWQCGDLIQATGAPLPISENAFTAYSWESGGTSRLPILLGQMGTSMSCTLTQGEDGSTRI